MTKPNVTVVESPTIEESPEQDRALARRLAPTQLAWNEGGSELCREQIQVHGEGAMAHMMMMGKWLIYARSEIDYGYFGKFIEQCGLSIDSAKRAMMVARRLSHKSFVRQLGSPTKAVALLGMSDAQLETLDVDGGVDGVTLDAIDSMTVVELRKKVRSLTNRVSKGKDQIAQHKEKIEALKDELDGRDVDDGEQQSPHQIAFGNAMSGLREFNDCVFIVDLAIPEEQRNVTHEWIVLRDMLAAIRERNSQIIDLSLVMNTKEDAA